MSSAYLLGYGLFCLFVLAGLNGFLLRKPQKERVGSNQADEPGVAVPPGYNTGHEVTDVPEKVVPKAEAGIREQTVEASIAANQLVAADENSPVGEESTETCSRMKKEADGSEADTSEVLRTGRIMTAIMIGAFVTILNQTLINVALPQMMNDFNVSANTIQWLITGFMLVNGVLIPITAFLIARFGTRKLFLTAMVFFSVGAMVCAAAPSYSVLLTGRLVQAVGAGIIMPLMMTVILTIFPPEKRGRAMGAIGIPMMFAPAIGPTLSGWIVEHYNWRILFYIVLPIALADLLLAFSWIKNVTQLSKPKFDLWGAIFSTLGFGGLLYGFSEAGNKGWGSLEVVLTLAIGVISLILFVWRELTVEEPMLELRVFKYEMFTLTTIISSVLNMALFAAMILLPIYLQNIRGFTPLESGLLLLPGAIVMAIMQPIAGAIFDKIGVRLLAIIGLTITVATSWEFSKLTADTTYSHMLLLYIMRMFGMSFMMMTIMTAGLNQLPRNLGSHGTAMANTTRQVAASLGTAFLVTVMTNRANFHLANFANHITADNPIIGEQVSGIGQGLAAVAGLPAQAGTGIVQQLIYGMAVKQSMIEGINDAFVVATGIAAVALVLAFFIKRIKPNTR